MSQITNYERAVNLIRENSDFYIEKERFERRFDVFLTRYRLYSANGKSLSEAIFKMKQIDMSKI
jgi:hypothetical protein